MCRPPHRRLFRHDLFWLGCSTRLKDMIKSAALLACVLAWKMNLWSDFIAINQFCK